MRLEVIDIMHEFLNEYGGKRHYNQQMRRFNDFSRSGRNNDYQQQSIRFEKPDDDYMVDYTSRLRDDDIRMRYVD